MEKYVIGDIHGDFEKLISCLTQVDFNYEKDQLISLGDVVDRGFKSYEVIEELLKIKNLTAIRGNHDKCFLDGLLSGRFLLFDQGCRATNLSYIKALRLDIPADELKMSDIPESHFNFLKTQLPYYIDNNNLFIHGGFNRHYLLSEHKDSEIFYWDRDLIACARSYESMKDKSYPFKMKENFNEIFVGHTPVQYFEPTRLPLKYVNINLLDTGCGKGGPLTLMNLNTREITQNK